VVQLHPHQEEAVAKLGNGKVLWGDVGSGKTIAAAAYYVRNEAPRDIYVITTAKKRNSLDWEKEFAAFAISRNSEATIAGVLTVDSWNNIGRYTDVQDAFFIFDEQRAVGSGAWADALIKIAKRNRWIMLSATPGDGWLDYIPLFIANGFYKNRTAFLREHAIFNRYAKYPKVDRFMGEPKLVRYKEELLVEMPFARHTTRHVQEICLDHDVQAMERVFKDRWHIYEERPLRDVAELFSVARKVVNSDLRRLEFVRSLMEKHPRLIVFYNFDYELETLRTLGSWSASSLAAETTPTSVSQRDASESRASESSTTSSTWPTKKTSETRSTSTPGGSRLPSAASTSQAEPATPSKSTTCETATSSTRQAESWQKAFPNDQISQLNDQVLNSTGTRSSASRRSSTSSSSAETGTTAEAVSGTDQPLSLVQPVPTADAPDVTSATTSPGRDTWTDTSTQNTSSSVTSGFSTARTSSSDSSTSESGGCTTSSNSSETFAIAEWNGHKHEEVPTTDRWVYLVQYTAGAEGWNCITTDTIVFYSLTYSYKIWHQAFGRIDRLNTPFSDLHYYVLQSNSWIDQAVRRSLAQKKNFNENKYNMRALESAA
jgi:hypothetical protein